jgi:hypothetical protein
LSQRKGLDASSKLGRAVFQLVDATVKMPAEVRARAIRIKNIIDVDPDDPMTRFKVNPELDILMRDPKLNAQVRAVQRAMPK